MRRRSLCALTLTVLTSLLLQSLPPATASAQEIPNSITVDPPLPEPPPPAPAPVAGLPPVADPKLPGLVLNIDVGTDTVRVGETVTVTLSITNRAPHAAENLSLILPLPDGAIVVDDGKGAALANGWSWNLGQLPGSQTTLVTATLRLTQIPHGEALLLTPSATARGLAEPVTADGGAMVDERVVSSGQLQGSDADIGLTAPALAPTTVPNPQPQDVEVPIPLAGRRCCAVREGALR